MQVRQGTPGFDEVQPAERAFKRTEKGLGELKRHQDELVRQRERMEALLEERLAQVERRSFDQLMGMQFLKQAATLELEEYERTTRHGIPSATEHAAALVIQRHARGKSGRGRFRSKKQMEVDKQFKAASMVQRFIRGKKERDRLKPLREAARKDAAGMAIIQTELHRRLPRLADRTFSAQYRIDFHAAQCREREALTAEFNRAAGAQTALDAFERLAAGEPTGRADVGHSIAATKQTLKQRMYTQMASAGVLRASSSRYVACKRRLGVIEVLKPWVQALPTPPDMDQAQMAEEQQKELVRLRQEHEDHFEEKSLKVKQNLELQIAQIDTSLTLTLSTLNSAVDSTWSSPALLRAIEAESVGNDLAYAIPLLQEAGLARVKPLREGSIIQITDAGIRTPHAKRIMNLAREGGTLDEAYYLECRDLEVAHAARTDTEKARQRAKLAMEHELAKLRERQDALYHDDLDEMNFDHLTARLEREGDEARPALDLAQLRKELAGKAEQAVREVEALKSARSRRAAANRRARRARGALKQLKSMAATELDQLDDERVKEAVVEVRAAEAGLIEARGAAVAAAAEAPMGDAQVHLAAMRAKLAMVEAFGDTPPSKTVVRTHAGYIETEIQSLKSEMSELAPHIAEYKAARDALGETLGALDCFTAGLVGNQMKAAALRKIWQKVDADGSGDLDRDEMKQVLVMMGDDDVGVERLDEVMQELDEDGGGSIEYAEFEAWYSKQDGAAREDAELVKRMFMDADADGGGTLDRQEIGKLLVKLNPALVRPNNSLNPLALVTTVVTCWLMFPSGMPQPPDPSAKKVRSARASERCSALL